MNWSKRAGVTPPFSIGVACGYDRAHWPADSAGRCGLRVLPGAMVCGIGRRRSHLPTHLWSVEQPADSACVGHTYPLTCGAACGFCLSRLHLSTHLTSFIVGYGLGDSPHLPRGTLPEKGPFQAMRIRPVGLTVILEAQSCNWLQYHVLRIASREKAHIPTGL